MRRTLSLAAVQAQEIEERRRQRAALASKRAQQSPAPTKPSVTPERSRSHSPRTPAAPDASQTDGTRGPWEGGGPSKQRSATFATRDDVDEVAVAPDGDEGLDAMFRPSNDDVVRLACLSFHVQPHAALQV